MTSEPPVESIFARSWALLMRNPVILVPGIVIGLVVGLIRGLLAPSVMVDTGAGVTYVQGGGVLNAAVLAIVTLLGYIATIAYTTGMAGAAWERGVTGIADGTAAWRADASHILVAIVGLVVLGVVAALLAFPTLGLSLLVYFLFTLYTMPAAVIGARPGFAAIGDSFRLAAARFWPTLLIGVLLAVIGALAGIVAVAFAFVPLLGPVLIFVVQDAVVAFAALVVVGEYLAFRRRLG